MPGLATAADAEIDRFVTGNLTTIRTDAHDTMTVGLVCLCLTVYKTVAPILFMLGGNRELRHNSEMQQVSKACTHPDKLWHPHRGDTQDISHKT